MKKLNILKIITSWVVFFWNLVAFAAIDHIEIKTNPEKFWAWDSVDLTIRAVWKDWKTDTTYKGSVMIYSPTDNSIILPNNWEYEFKDNDAWIKTFENTLKFTKDWEHTLEVLDLETWTFDVLWTMEFSVWASTSSTTPSKNVVSSSWTTSTWSSTKTTTSSSSSKADITITYPTAWIELWKKAR